MLPKHANRITAVAIVLMVISLVLVFVWFNIVTVTAVSPPGERALSLDVIALQIAILEMFLAVFGIALGVVALFGYVGIRTGVEAKAMEVAREAAQAVATAQMAQFQEQERQRLSGFTSESSGGKLVPPSGAVKVDAE